MSKFKTIHEAIDETLQYAKGRMEGSITSLKTGFPKLDKAMIDGIEWNSTITIGGRPSVGKCLGKGTSIIMFDGSIKKVEDVKIGDLLMSPYSTPVKVISTIKGKDQMYKVEQLRGVTYRVNSSHILSLKRGKTEKKQKHGKIKNISVEDYIKLSESTKIKWKGYISDFIEFPEVNLVIDPYMVGLWLGDGTSCKTAITTIDSEIISFIESFSVDNNLKVRKEGKYGYIMKGKECKKNKFLEFLRNEDMFCNKHIPKKYILNSRKNRLSLLAGLIDSDGYINNSSTIEITLKQETIIKDLSFLCNSLGFRTSIKTKKGTFKRKDGTIFSNTYYRLMISGDLSIIPLKIKRKKEKLRNSSRNSKMTKISVIKDTYDEYFGFELEGGNLFLLEDFTVTHNSAVSDCIIDGCFASNDIDDFHLLDFNWELSSRVILLRRLSAKLKKSYKHIISAEKNKLTKEEYLEIVQYLTEYYGNLPITYCEEPLSVREFSDTVERFYREVKKKLLVRIDHTLLTKMTANDGGQVQMLLNLLMAANTLKKKYPIIFLFLTQINREFEDRQMDGTDGAFPRQGDVYGGDAAAMFSETIILLNKPSKYGIRQYGRRGGAISLPIEDNDLFAHVVKNRNSQPDLILHYKEDFKNMTIKEY